MTRLPIWAVVAVLVLSPLAGVAAAMLVAALRAGGVW